MERNIPHVLDIFAHSPGQRRRNRSSEQFLSRQLKEEKNPGSDSAVSLGSSDDEDENDQKISKYFNYLNEDEKEKDQAAQQSKAKNTLTDDKTKTSRHPKEQAKKADPKTSQNQKDGEKDDRSRKGEYEMKHIERHLSMKKTIRKKMMRDLQQAFVENPKEFTQDLDDTERMAVDKKIDLNNLTISKKRMSKSEHSFLDMLKDDKKKDPKKGYPSSKRSSKDPDDDSGNDSPTRKVPQESETYRSKSKNDLLDVAKDEKKPSFWKRLTGKGKSKR